MNLSFRSAVSLIFGNNTLSLLGEEVAKLDIEKVLIVTDPGIAATPVLDAAISALGEIKYEIFDQVEPEPTLNTVAKAYSALGDCNGVIGLGGGSSMDVAKVIAVVGKYGGEAKDYLGIGNTPGRGLPTILVPTTSGTASEVTPNAVIVNPSTNAKEAVVSPFILPDCSIVDPMLTISLPKAITASTGMDALTHAVEAYTVKKSSSLTDPLALESIRLVGQHLKTAYARGDDVHARYGMAMASTVAGLAFGNAGVAAVHAFAYPIGTMYSLSHGLSNSLMLPYIVEYNLVGNEKKFATVAEALGENVTGMSLYEAARTAPKAILALAEDLKLPTRLRDIGAKEEDIPKLAEGVVNIIRLLENNPRSIDLEDAKDIYKKAF